MQLRPLTRLFVALLLAAAALTACPAGPTSPEHPTDAAWPSSAEVDLRGGLFKPEQVTIAAGGSVTWRNRDAVRYAVTIDALGVDHVLDPGQTFTLTFERAGDYRVTDSLNPRGLVSSVRVK